eukprot:7902413-Prorocentrum_lima.AAC.1
MQTGEAEEPQSPADAPPSTRGWGSPRGPPRGTNPRATDKTIKPVALSPHLSSSKLASVALL